MRKVLLALLILNALLLPLAALPLLFLANTVNPLQLVFITSFTVENRTLSRVLVTPVGTVGPEGEREPLPLALWRVPWWPSVKRGSFSLPAGATITLHYDCDDINFSEIVVELENGDLRQLVVNPEPTKNQYTPPRATHFVIEDRGELEVLDPRVREAHREAQIPAKWWPLLLGGSATLLTFLVLLAWYYKGGRRASRGGSGAVSRS